jgi:hypothetical protein
MDYTSVVYYSVSHGEVTFLLESAVQEMFIFMCS